MRFHVGMDQPREQLFADAGLPLYQRRSVDACNAAGGIKRFKDGIAVADDFQVGIADNNAGQGHDERATAALKQRLGWLERQCSPPYITVEFNQADVVAAMLGRQGRKDVFFRQPVAQIQKPRAQSKILIGSTQFQPGIAVKDQPPKAVDDGKTVA